MTIIHISDTHGKHKEIDLGILPLADMIVHSGDFTFAGSEQEAYDFMNWFCDLPYRHKIFIAGNHDMCMYGAAGIEGLPDDVHYLCNSGVEIEGAHFFGIPMFLEDVEDGSIDRMIEATPSNTDVLITHHPPYGVYGDMWNGKHCGDKRLRQTVDSLPNLRFHLFGHQHEANCIQVVGKVCFSNAAVIDSHYKEMLLPNIIHL